MGKWTEDELLKASQLKNDGRTLKEIAIELKRSIDSVKNKLYGNWDRYYLGNKETAKKRGRDWHQDNMDRSKKNKKEWYKKNADHHIKLVKTARAANLDHYKAYLKQWTKDNPDKVKAAGRRWDTKHPLKRKQINDRRRVKIGKMVGTHTSTEWRKRIKEFDGKCAYCEVEFDSKIKVTRDHLIPIDVQPIGYIWNIVPACQSCNSKKHTSDCISFIKKNGYSFRPQLVIALEGLQDI